jgi:hypothetical protein
VRRQLAQTNPRPHAGGGGGGALQREEEEHDDDEEEVERKGAERRGAARESDAALYNHKGQGSGKADAANKGAGGGGGGGEGKTGGKGGGKGVHGKCGLGLTLRNRDGKGVGVTIKRIKEGGPAAVSRQIFASDRLLSVDNVELDEGLSGEEVAKLIVGRKGSLATLTLRQHATGKVPLFTSIYMYEYVCIYSHTTIYNYI